jgi:cytochrome c oxidase subunit 4
MNLEPPAAQSMLRKSNAVGVSAVVWSLLLLLTAATVTSAQLRLGKFTIIACLAIASIKSILVLLYFMHLRHERRLVVKLAVPIALVVLAIFIGLTFTDVIAR